jgi:hypothetical protein
MEFDIKRDSDNRRVAVNTVDNNGGDSFTTERDPFRIDPSRRADENLGMEFLVGDKDEEEDEEEEVQDNQESLVEYETGSNDGMFHQEPIPEENFEKVQGEKSFYLSQLNRLRKKGQSTRSLTMQNSLEEIRGEVMRVKKEMDMDNGVNYCRQGLMFAISTIEMCDGNYNNNSFALKGWSQNVMTDIENYDTVFEELYDKYYSTVTMSPEIKLITMVAGSAFMFSLQKKMLSGQNIPERQREMKGPSIDTDALLEELNDLDLEEISNLSERSEESIKIEEPVPQDETKVIDIKKRGRPRKKKV